MNPSFEEMWNGPTSPRCTEPEEDLFASMQPYRVPNSEFTGNDAEMVEAYKKYHSSNVLEAPNDLEMISSKNICKKCMLHSKVCRVFGQHLKMYETDKHFTELMNSLDNSCFYTMGD